MANEEIKDTKVQPKFETKAAAQSVGDIVSAMAVGDTTIEKVATFTTLQTDLGNMWAHAVTNGTPEDTDTNTTILYDLRAARKLVATSASTNSTDKTYDTQTDAAMTLANALRAVEKNLPTGLKNLVSGCATAVNTAITAITTKGVKSYFRTDTTNKMIVIDNATPSVTNNWDDNFRDLWRYTTKEELCVPVKEYTKAAGTWGATSGSSVKTATLASALEIVPIKVTGTDVSIVGYKLYYPDGTYVEKTLTTPITITKADYTKTYVIDSGVAKYVKADLVFGATPGGTDADVIQVWIK